jgi:SPP1 family predicted phage head-tail adaptor
MNPGELTHQIVLQRKRLVQDSELNMQEDWVDWRTVWCSPLPKTGREYYKLAASNSEIEEVFKIYYVGWVSSHLRIKFRGKSFEIIGPPINPGERNEELLLACKAVA